MFSAGFKMPSQGQLLRASVQVCREWSYEFPISGRSQRLGNPSILAVDTIDLGFFMGPFSGKSPTSIYLFVFNFYMLYA